MERAVSEAPPRTPLYNLVGSTGRAPTAAGIFSFPKPRRAARPGVGRGPEPPRLRLGRLHLISRSAGLQTARGAERVNQERLPAVVLWSKP